MCEGGPRSAKSGRSKASFLAVWVEGLWEPPWSCFSLCSRHPSRLLASVGRRMEDDDVLVLNNCAEELRGKKKRNGAKDL